MISKPFLGSERRTDQWHAEIKPFESGPARARCPRALLFSAPVDAALAGRGGRCRLTDAPLHQPKLCQRSPRDADGEGKVEPASEAPGRRFSEISVW
jgi:hypothetical protein